MLKYKVISTILIIASIGIVLSACTKEEDTPENTAPTASFTVTPNLGNTATDFVLDASASSDNEDAPATLSFRWDINNDGTWDTPFSTNAHRTLSYNQEGSYTIKLEVKDTGGLSSFDTKDVEVDNNINVPPNVPSNPVPSNQATGVGTDIILSWTCTDPNQDPLTYDVYLGTTANPSKVAGDINNNSYDPGQLDPNTKYYWKIVARDDGSLTTEGPVWEFTTGSGPSFICGNPFTDIRDGKVYGTHQFGQKCWMTRNLNYGTRIDGNQEQSDNDIAEKYCYNDEDANCNTYGALYQWKELMQYQGKSNQGLCPAGWHPASLEEWQALEMELGMSQADAETETGWVGTDQGKQLKEDDFKALMSGYRSTAGSFVGESFTGRLWVGTAKNSANGWNRNLNSDDDRVQHAYSTMEHGYAVRCVRD